jgi:hypothetical protein
MSVYENFTVDNVANNFDIVDDIEEKMSISGGKDCFFGSTSQIVPDIDVVFVDINVKT